MTEPLIDTPFDIKYMSLKGLITKHRVCVL
jgi:hypothetical protein